MISGFHQLRELAVPVTAGTHVIRFTYVKDGSIDTGLDRVWVDDVRFVERNGGVFDSSTFSDAEGCSIPNWDRGGEGGGWCVAELSARREWRSPLAMSNAGPQSGPRSAGIERDIEWPLDSGNFLLVDYLVDSEQDHDFFRILVDDVERFRVSGLKQVGLEQVPVDPGVHHVRLEYLKDESGDQGLDEARVRGISVRSGNRIIELGGIDGSPLGSPLPGWTSVSSEQALQWVSVDPRSPRVYLKPNQLTYQVDGMATKSEYEPEGKVELLPRLGGIGNKGRAWFSTSSDGKTLFSASLPNPVGEWLRQGGVVTVLLSTAVPSESSSPECGANSALPGSQSRRLELSLDELGEVSVSQMIGTCGIPDPVPWRVCAPQEEWPVLAAAYDDAESASLNLEVEITPPIPSGLPAPSVLALSLLLDVWVPDQGMRTVFALPGLPDDELSEDNVSTWEQIHLISEGLVPHVVPWVRIDNSLRRPDN